MALSTADTLRLSRRLGFGFRPEEDVPDDFIGWASAQLTAKPVQVGVAAIPGTKDPADAPKPEIVEWPDKYTQPLEAQVTRLVAYRTAYEALEKKLDPSSNEYAEARGKLDAKYDYLPWDITRRSHQAIYGATPVLERFAHFWANHLTVAPKDHTEHILGHLLDRGIRDNLAGDFETLLGDVIHHPAMMIYLDNAYSVGPNSSNGKYRRSHGQQADVNENLARELLELHTLSPAAGYTQDDIVGIAKLMTGWGYTFDQPPAISGIKGKDRWRPFFKMAHEPGGKTALGQTYKEGPAALDQLLGFLANHDATIQHVSSKLARYFIADEPSADDVAAIADTWRASKGNLPAIHQKVIELTAAAATRKFQQPEIWLYQALRSSGADLFPGFEQVTFDYTRFDDTNRSVENLLFELGQSYWFERQPNGFSDTRADWVSPEHMERRLRFSQLIESVCRPALGVDQLADRLGVGDATRMLYGKGVDDRDKFVLLLCSPDMMEA